MSSLNITPVSDQAVALEVHFPLNGEIKLDQKMVDESINKFIHYYLNSNGVSWQEGELELSRLIKKNPKGNKLLERIKLFAKNQFIEGLLTWLNFLDRNSRNPLIGMKKLSEQRKIPFTQLSLHDLIESYFSTLFDASYLNTITGYEFDALRRPKIIKTEVLVHGSLATSINVLTEIAEHARQSGEREGTGYLIGKRNFDNSIIGATQYEPIMLGAQEMTTVDVLSIAKIMEKYDNIGEKIVGFVHTHPYKGAPTYSLQDKITHVKLAAGISIFEHLASSYDFVPRDLLIKISMYLSQFNFYQVKNLLEVINGIISNSRIFNEFLKALSQQNPDTWSTLEEQIKSMLKQYQINTIPIFLQYIPLAGVVICPWGRMIGIIDCVYEDEPRDPNLPTKEWFYYRIGIKKE